MKKSTEVCSSGHIGSDRAWLLHACADKPADNMQIRPWKTRADKEALSRELS